MELLFILFLIYKFIHGTFKADTATRFSLIIILIYSAIMMILAIKYEYSILTIIATFALSFIGIIIGIFQAYGAEVSISDNLNKYHVPKITIKRGLNYLIGWIIIFILGLLIKLLFEQNINHKEIFGELSTELLRDLSKIFFFTDHSTWFMWILNTSSSWTYDTYLFLKYPTLRKYVLLRKK